MKIHCMKRIVVLSLLLASILISPSTLTAGNDCPGQRWVEQHRSALPQTYDQFLAAPAGLRRIIFDNLAPEVQGRLWVTHLQRYLRRNPRLSAEQVAVVHQAIDLAMRPETFGTPRDSELWDLFVGEPLKELEASVRAVFNARQTAAILSELGGREVMEAPILAGAKVTTTVFCQCATTSDWCTGGAVCIKDGGGCTHQQGCGAFWQHICNGLCGERITLEYKN